LRQSVVKEKEYYLALGCILLTVLVWGFSYISAKIVLEQIPPISIAFWRQIVAMAILIPWVIFSKSISRLSLKNIGIIAALSFFGIVAYFILENHGLQLTTASNASMIVSALPILTMVSEALFFKLKINWKMALCLILSILGVYLVVTVNGKLDLSSTRFLGNLLVMGSMICWVVYTILNKGLSGEYSSITITAYQSFFSIFWFMPLIRLEASRWPELTALSLNTLVNLLFLGIFCSALAYICYLYAVKRLGATLTAAFLNLIPVVTIISGFLVLHERLFPTQLTGIALIMFSLYSLNRVTPRPDSITSSAAALSTSVGESVKR
jgi:drug/metabolite transporter (DMT)-like permease